MSNKVHIVLLPYDRSSNHGLFKMRRLVFVGGTQLKVQSAGTLAQNVSITRAQTQKCAIAQYGQQGAGQG